MLDVNFTRKHESLSGCTPAEAMKLADHRWTLDEVINMIEAFHKAKDDAKFEAAFAESNFVVQPRAKKTYAPVKPKTPWYTAPQCGGKCCPVNERKAGADYSA